MIASNGFRVSVLALFIAFTGFLGALQIVNAASAKADFTLAVSPANKSVSKGVVATYTVTMGLNNGYKNTVALTASIPGSNATATFTPAALNGKTTASTLSVSTANANLGNWLITITGSDGTTTHTATAALEVTAQPSNQKFTLAATPPSRQVLPGDIAQYAVTINRNTGFTSPVTLAASGLPSGASASFAPSSPVTGSSSTLQIDTTSSTPAGSYTVTVTASEATATTQTATVSLEVADKGKPFSISGSVGSPLSPGASPAAINLVFNNPNNQLLDVTNVTVTVTGTSAGSACSASNFEVQQYSGTYPLVIPKDGSASLQSLTRPQASWPTIQLVSSPTDNQDSCKSVDVYLSYSGLGQG
jgi:hypothetical protein